jgi:hypothetical protein
MPVASMSAALGYAPSQQTVINVAYGYVSTEQPAPATLDDPVYVVIPSHSTEHSEAMAFPAIHGTTLPAPGTDCLVGRDERGKWWLLSWTGSYGA